ncbi:CMRF35-like molecule 3 [Terrapene carolina triunguis]|uniref:CMRF35-like molecule 3 n=1 Tax=Terrapene triunguis TaxID=2587831 RepID=UPI000CEFC34A|nr:CMRF35-like molecule 3 [Terrapene carolina triunguis]
MTGSEAIVKHDRVSIKDIHTFCTFIVTMKNLTEKDSGTYWCGIDKLGLDLMFSVKVNVLPAVPASPPPAPMRETTVHAASTESPFRWTAPEVAESNSMVHSSNPPAGYLETPRRPSLPVNLQPLVRQPSACPWRRHRTQQLMRLPMKMSFMRPRLQDRQKRLLLAQ